MKMKHLLSLMVLISSLGTIMPMEQATEPIQETNLQSNNEIYNSEGERLATSESTSPFVGIYDNRTQKLLCKLVGHTAPITCLAWHPDSSKNLIVTGSEDTTIKLWDACTGRCLKTLDLDNSLLPYKSPITSIAFSNSDELVCIAGNTAGLALLIYFSLASPENKPLYTPLAQEEHPIKQILFNESYSIVGIVSNTKLTMFVKDTDGTWLNRKIFFNLPDSKKVDSIKQYDNDIIFVQTSDLETGASRSIILKIFDNELFEVAINVFDYCEQTKNYLTCTNKYNVIEDSYESPKVNDPLFTAPMPIKSANYHNNGTRIIIRTNQQFYVFEKAKNINNEDTWIFVFSENVPSQLQYNAERSEIASSNSTEDLMEQDDNTNATQRPVSLKRNSSVLEKDTTPQSSKYQKTSESGRISSTMDDETDDEDSILLIDVQEDEHPNAPLIQNSTIPEDNTQNNEIAERRERESKTLLLMYDLMSINPAILDLSLTDLTGYAPHVIEKYLAYKSLINESANLDQRDNEGKTAVLKAVEEKNENILKLLVERGASVNLADRQERTPLHVAVQIKHSPIIAYLLAQHALVNVTNNQDETPLHIAVRNQDLEAVTMLLLTEPDLDILDRNQETVLSLVIKSKNVDLIRIFAAKLRN